MQLMKPIEVVTVVLVAAALTSCSGGSAPEPTQDANVVYTSVAGTMIAQLNIQQTQTAQAIPPSPLPSRTPVNTFTPLPVFPVTPLGSPISIATATQAGLVLPATSTGGGTPGSTAAGCNDSKFISESEPADLTQFSRAENFTKSWTFLNTGTCPWTNGFSLGFQSGARLGAKNIVISRSVDYVSPGQTKTFTVFFQAPNAAGRYLGYWHMRTPTGGSFGSLVWVEIIVK